MFGIWHNGLCKNLKPAHRVAIRIMTNYTEMRYFINLPCMKDKHVVHKTDHSSFSSLGVAI